MKDIFCGNKKVFNTDEHRQKWMNTDWVVQFHRSYYYDVLTFNIN